MSRETIYLETRSEVQYSVIWMHGLGASSDDFVPIVEALNLPQDLPGIRFIFPNAPLRPVSLNAGYVMPAWYDLYHLDLEKLRKKEDEWGLRQSEALIQDLIQQEINAHIREDHIFLAGFSQGAVMTLMAGLRYPKSLAGLIVLSGYMPLLSLWQKEVHPCSFKTPIFLAHGQKDPVVPFELFSETFNLLEPTHRVQPHVYQMEHSVCLEEVRDISLFIQSIINSSQKG